MATKAGGFQSAGFKQAFAQLVAGPGVKTTSPGEGRRVFRTRAIPKHVGERKRG